MGSNCRYDDGPYRGLNFSVFFWLNLTLSPVTGLIEEVMEDGREGAAEIDGIDIEMVLPGNIADWDTSLRLIDDDGCILSPICVIVTGAILWQLLFIVALLLLGDNTALAVTID